MVPSSKKILTLRVGKNKRTNLPCVPMGCIKFGRKGNLTQKTTRDVHLMHGGGTPDDRRKK